ncbi:MAG: phycobilisome protein [Leptolyngbya sp.]|nr:MAG: phycobilisome protein [Leptolyngbya sp.]
MHALNYKLDKSILEADGRYLDSQELYPLESYIQSYEIRLNTYKHLQDHGEKLVILALRKLAQLYPELIQQHGSRCKYDMTEVLRYIALSILRDDELLFKEKMLAWLDTILLAHKRNDHCRHAYQNLQEAIAANFVAAETRLIRPYLELTLHALESHA